MPPLRVSGGEVEDILEAIGVAERSDLLFGVDGRDVGADVVEGVGCMASKIHGLKCRRALP
jgi:hypothetical protein